ncbi:hypothetical protein FOA43_000797 [Brettanomyces nanus]|uniref:Indoleamine 2,3-dioxygenase n=1 Tax=Eeniella nana TaxID=13502 RepID=A0A875RWZ0_EENNA|nr:uncharacterized protein FOA43_000797 [Brettanomyces nanus]QPG73486.1 hypothetical protein FOA43_000797 [Brettanomyces nanus]
MNSYTYPLPNLEDYDVSPKTGFLPEEIPLNHLPPYYETWERIVKNLPALLLTRRVRSMVDKLPYLTCEHLTSESEYRRAYSVLGYIAHAYIWGVNETTDRLPKQIADAWIKVSAHLELPPIATYAGLVLWNWEKIIPEEDDATLEDFLNNLKVINTFTGSLDECWFYLVSIYFEYKGASVITTGMDAIKYARQDKPDKVRDCVQALAEHIDYLGTVLMSMQEMCDPHVFYFELRPYLAGWKNMQDVGLKGVYYGDLQEPKLYSGGSNAQSSLIQTLDLLLNINHYSTGESSSNSSENAFMNEMKKYMPGKHAKFLNHLAKVNIIRDYVTSRALSHPDLLLSYNAAVAMMKTFRDKHIQIVTRYIVLQAQKSQNLGSEGAKTIRAGLAKGRAPQKSMQLKGTGGTALLPFLKQCRDETGSTAAGNWGRRLLTDGPAYKKKKDVESEISLNTKPSVGLSSRLSDDKSNLKYGHW